MYLRVITISFAFALLLAAVVARAGPVGTAFTYQGRLTDAGQAAEGAYDLSFALYDQVSGGDRVGGPMVQTNVAVSGGLVSTTLDFGPAVFGSGAVWVEVRVRSAGGVADFTTLTPRQALLAVPLAMRALSSATASVATNSLGAPWSGLTGVPSGFADGIDNDTTYSAGPGLQLSGTTFSVAPGGIGSAGLADGAVTGVKLAGGVVTPDKVAVAGFSNVFWKVDGNAGTSPGTHFVGTTDNKAMEFKVNSARALRLEPTNNAPNVILGAANNSVVSAYGAAIAGGINNLASNANQSIVLGGWSNIVGADLTAAGGLLARATNKGSFVWSDAAGFPFGSTNTNQFRVRALGGAEFVTAATRDAVAASVKLTSTGGVAIVSLSPTNAALDLAQGFIRVAGASTRTNSPVFIHRVTPSNSATNWSIIDHPLCNGDPSAVLLVTPNLNPNDPTGTNHVGNLTAVGVFYTGNHNPWFTGAQANRWALYFTDASRVDFNATFNMLVIKP